ncbi:MAG: hypothetical protein ACFFC6_04420, partial [Promethearchaeota archaeon]
MKKLKKIVLILIITILVGFLNPTIKNLNMILDIPSVNALPTYQLDQSQPSNPTAWYIPNATEDGGVEWQSFVPTADNINRVNLSIENSGIADPTGETISVWINDEGNTLTPLVGATIDMS